MKKLLLLILVWCTVSCGQTVYTHLVWNYNYKNTAGQELDTLDITFHSYYCDSSSGVYDFYTETADTFVYLLANDTLYQNKQWWFYILTHCLPDTTYSVPSDTVMAFFPFIKPGKVYNPRYLGIED